MKKILVATNNPGKIKEISSLFSPLNIETVTLTGINVEEPEETGLTFLDNAIIKAEYYGKLYNLPALSDDSGLCIEALDGYPGVISARIAGPNKDYKKAFSEFEKLLNQKGLNSSPAFFITSLVLRLSNGEIIDFEGRIDGTIQFPAIGENGMGYDPIFIPKGYNKTFAQMSFEEKNNISHRKIAFSKFMDYLKKNF